MSVLAQIKQDVVIIGLQGRFLGMEDNNEFRGLVDKKMAAGFRWFIVDFTGNEWIDSAGMGTIIATQMSVSKKDGDMRVARLTDRVAYYFDLCNLDAIFKRYPTVQQAVDSFYL